MTFTLTFKNYFTSMEKAVKTRRASLLKSMDQTEPEQLHTTILEGSKIQQQ